MKDMSIENDLLKKGERYLLESKVLSSNFYKNQVEAGN